MSTRISQFHYGNLSDLLSAVKSDTLPYPISMESFANEPWGVFEHISQGQKSRHECGTTACLAGNLIAMKIGDVVKEECPDYVESIDFLTGPVDALGIDCDHIPEDIKRHSSNKIYSTCNRKMNLFELMFSEWIYDNADHARRLQFALDYMVENDMVED